MSFEVGSVWNNRAKNMAVCLYTSKSEKLSIFISYKINDEGVFQRTSNYIRANSEGLALERENAADILKEDPNVMGTLLSIHPAISRAEQSLDFNFKLWYYGPTQNDMTKFELDMAAFQKFCNSGKSCKSTKEPSSEDELIKFLVVEINKTRIYLTELERILKTKGYRKEEKLPLLRSPIAVVEKPEEMPPMCVVNSQGDINLIPSRIMPMPKKTVMETNSTESLFSK